jgi:hypothetical protein
MNFKLTVKNQITKEVEVIEYYEKLEQANKDLSEIWQGFNDCAIVKPSPIITNEKGLSFCYSSTGRHEIYQVEKCNYILDKLFDIMKPVNQN